MSPPRRHPEQMDTANTRVFVESKEKKHSWKDAFLHHDPAKYHHHDESGKGKTSAAAIKTEDGAELVQQRSPGLWQKYQAHVAKDNTKQTNDDIWGHYRGPGH